jgi:D-glycero-D-manno-heptose 1,7-bisphosphate phosphatase
MNKCVFLDRDGVLNQDRVDYVYRIEDWVTPDGALEALRLLKEHGYLLVVVTNQSGIAKGIYTRDDMHACHRHLQALCNGAIDAFYYAPYHPAISESLTRKPDSLMFERAIAKFQIDPAASWMVGDKPRDLEPARKLGIGTLLIDYPSPCALAQWQGRSLLEAAHYLLQASGSLPA